MHGGAGHIDVKNDGRRGGSSQRGASRGGLSPALLLQPSAAGGALGADCRGVHTRADCVISAHHVRVVDISLQHRVGVMARKGLELRNGAAALRRPSD